MAFCNKCHNLFGITRSTQGLDKYSDYADSLFSKIGQNQPIQKKDLAKLNAQDVTQDERYQNMSKKEQRRISDLIKAVNPDFFKESIEEKQVQEEEAKAYYLCKMCKNTKPIKPGTLIYSKSYASTGLQDNRDYTYARYDPTYFLTQNYVCPNPKCKTHKEPSLKEAVLAKSASNLLVYVCSVCNQNWTL